MALIELEEMEFFANHGCFEEERLTGNQFLVHLSFETYTIKAEKSDKIDDTINYQEVYEIVKQEMNIPSSLLEHLAARITDKVCAQFTDIEKIQVKVSKVNPPLGGKLKCVSVTITR
jgi:dihydroneopterin aldolase